MPHSYSGNDTFIYIAEVSIANRHRMSWTWRGTCWTISICDLWLNLQTYLPNSTRKNASQVSNVGLSPRSMDLALPMISDNGFLGQAGYISVVQTVFPGLNTIGLIDKIMSAQIVDPFGRWNVSSSALGPFLASEPEAKATVLVTGVMLFIFNFCYAAARDTSKKGSWLQVPNTLCQLKLSVNFPIATEILSPGTHAHGTGLASQAVTLGLAGQFWSIQ
ncbi:MFS sugar transporter protein [Rutstroemia sp. NJR-2017a BVV2]|nr:MFS sugar transporter protein [Rutstroemia sp. NJR-2017a BVV2]